MAFGVQGQSFVFPVEDNVNPSHPLRRRLGIFRASALALLLASTALLCVPPRAANAYLFRLYVKGDASGANSGTSWTDAYVSLQSALEAAAGGGYEIWVAAGTFKPWRNLLPGASDTFQLSNNVALYGGFAGTETERSQRNWMTNVTTLSGYTRIGSTNYHAYHVVTGTGTDGTAVLDGFTVTGGNATGTGNDSNGGGMLNLGGSPTVSNVIFSGNSAALDGGGMYSGWHNAIVASPTLTNITFTNNSALGGGGMFSGGGNSTLTNITFSGNSASGDVAGGIYIEGGHPTLTNVIFSGNSAPEGGGMYIAGTNVTLINVSFSANSANSATGVGGAIVIDPWGGLGMVNSILWGDTSNFHNEIHNMNAAYAVAVSYSDIQGGYTGTGNINSDPKFIRNPNPGIGDYGNLHLQPGSPAIDAGNSAAFPNNISTDLEGNLRLMGKAVDMGAYEAFAKSFLPLIKK